MRRRHENIKEFKNGNLNIKFTPNDIQDAQKDELLTLVSVLDNVDCYFIGDTYCLSNFETGHTIYNAYSDLVYVFPWSCLDELKQEKTVKLYARTPDGTDRETIYNDFYKMEV